MKKDPVKIANDLIKKGKALSDNNLIEIGKAILAKIENKNQSNFIAPTRKENAENLRYVDGKQEGKYAKKKPIDLNKIKINTFRDDGTIGNDKDNETIKKNSIISPRARKPFEFKLVKCSACGKEQQVHPLHAKGEYYKCDSCIYGKRTQ